MWLTQILQPLASVILYNNSTTTFLVINKQIKLAGRSMKSTHLSLPMLTALLLSACGGGGSSGVSTGAANAVTTGTESAPSTNVLTGRFVDSAVEGLQYTTESQTGTTGVDGTYSYMAGESVTFSIGDIVLPSVPAATLITPLTVFSTDNITDPRVMNLAVLLQTLDTDGDPVGGIEISDAAIASATGLEVDFSSPEFENQVSNLVANSGSINTSLVNMIEAVDHLQETLFVEGVDERPEAPPAVENLPAPSTDNTSTHPLVGTSAVFSDLAHDISGTLTVIDDRTLEVSDFFYDGGGVQVFFYTGTDGNYREGTPGAGPIGSQLNGRRFSGETIRLTIPENLTLDDFNGISVWCIPFSANFGDAVL